MQVRGILTTELFFVAVLSGFQASGAEVRGPMFGRAVAVLDEDTIKILTAQEQQITIRMAEIEAPEKDHLWDWHHTEKNKNHH